jgi:hypothetical protein
VDVTTRDEEIARASFNEARRRTKVLDLSRVRRGGNQCGIPAGFCRTMHIRQQQNSITHWHRNVVIVCYGMRRL